MSSDGFRPDGPAAADICVRRQAAKVFAQRLRRAEQLRVQRGAFRRQQFVRAIDLKFQKGDQVRQLIPVDQMVIHKPGLVCAAERRKEAEGRPGNQADQIEERQPYRSAHRRFSTRCLFARQGRFRPGLRHSTACAQQQNCRRDEDRIFQLRADSPSVWSAAARTLRNFTEYPFHLSAPPVWFHGFDFICCRV